MRGRRPGAGLVAATVAVALLAACGGEPKAQSAGAAGAAAVTDPAAIVADLWKRRQAGMLTEDAAVFEKVDTGALKPHDLSIAHLVACGCSAPRRQSPLDRVLVLRSQQPAPNLLFAEVFTHAPGGGPDRFWVVAQKVGASWRLAFDADDPFDIEGGRRFIDPTTIAPATTAQDQQAGAAVLQREVTESLRWLRTGQPMSPDFTGNALRSRLLPGVAHGDRGRTDYGADTVSSLEIHRQDPIFTFRLDTKRVLTCGAIHAPTTVLAPAGKVLVQPPDQKAWGPELPAGHYRAVTMDTQQLTCVLDHGPSAKPRYEAIGDYHSDIAATGRAAQ